MRPSTVGALCLSAATGAAFFAYSTITAAARESSYSNGQVIETEALDAIALSGGGSVTIKPGNSSTVKILDGAESLKLEVENGTLKISCIKPCPRDANHKLEVTMNELEAIALTGGGWMTVDGTFEERDDFSIAITGGGSIDAYGVPAEEVDVAITGGGSIKVSASKELNVAIIGGGSIKYKGDPEISKAILGGGSVSKA